MKHTVKSLNKTHQIRKLKWLSSSLAVAFGQIHWSHVLSWEWRCSWSSADRRCSNYIWVINNFIANSGATYIRGLTVTKFTMSNFHYRRSGTDEAVNGYVHKKTSFVGGTTGHQDETVDVILSNLWG